MLAETHLCALETDYKMPALVVDNQGTGNGLGDNSLRVESTSSAALSSLRSSTSTAVNSTPSGDILAEEPHSYDASVQQARLLHLSCNSISS